MYRGETRAGTVPSALPPNRRGPRLPRICAAYDLVVLLAFVLEELDSELGSW
jgi:hypothetical protein